MESFSYENSNFVKDVAFFKDNPQDENSPNWVKYRLSLAHMKEIANQSTYFRATCQFPVDGVKYVDYLLGRLSEANLVEDTINRCVKYEYINIRGSGCYSCTTNTIQTTIWHIHLDSYWSDHCGMGRVPGALSGGSNGEVNFGWYVTSNSKHLCNADMKATTQWWFGGS